MMKLLRKSNWIFWISLVNNSKLLYILEYQKNTFISYIFTLFFLLTYMYIHFLDLTYLSNYQFSVHNLQIHLNLLLEETICSFSSPCHICAIRLSTTKHLTNFQHIKPTAFHHPWTWAINQQLTLFTAPQTSATR